MAILVASVAFAQAAEAKPRKRGGVCFATAVAEVHYGAGAFTDTRTITNTFTAHDRPCRMSVRSIRSAVEHGEASGTFNCSTASAHETGTDIFHWSNGRRSVLAYENVVVGGVGDTTGVVTKGLFRGLRVRYIGPSIPFPDICSSQKAGVTKGAYTGVGMFGDYVPGIPEFDALKGMLVAPFRSALGARWGSLGFVKPL